MSGSGARGSYESRAIGSIVPLSQHQQRKARPAGACSREYVLSRVVDASLGRWVAAAQLLVTEHFQQLRQKSGPHDPASGEKKRTQRPQSRMRVLLTRVRAGRKKRGSSRKPGKEERNRQAAQTGGVEEAGQKHARSGPMCAETEADVASRDHVTRPAPRSLSHPLCASSFAVGRKARQVHTVRVTSEWDAELALVYSAETETGKRSGREMLSQVGARTSRRGSPRPSSGPAPSSRWRRAG